MKLETDFPRRRSSIIMDSRRRRYILIAAVIGLIFLFSTHSSHSSALLATQQGPPDSYLKLPALPPANATLGVRSDTIPTPHSCISISDNTSLTVWSNCRRLTSDLAPPSRSASRSKHHRTRYHYPSATLLERTRCEAPAINKRL